MEQHPIPQQITSYEFKLVGDMTLKQFGKAAGGIIIALLINSSKLVFFIKWPLMIMFAAGGLALAFVPFQDRPLETWLMAFIKSIYSPTIYTYKKESPENWLEIDLSKQLKSDEEEEVVVPIKEDKKVKEFINSLPSIGRENQVIMPPEVGTDLVEEKKEENLPPEADQPLAEKSKEEIEEKKEVEVKPVNLDLKTEKLGATGTAVFGEIPMPDIPDLPNLVVGMVLDPNHKIVEGAIVEIQDKDGNPSRVLKTNKLGQFKTLTQLSDGKYLVVTEKEDLEFDRVEINLTGKIVEPIKILAK
ncbi:MAG TPA: PrgI family protein [Candidatus Woesebacteria bacterium]|nr:PrgI family protein [Candidatus Woesebacteria bacterium]